MKYKIHQLTQQNGSLTKSIPSKVHASQNSTAIIVHLFYMDIWEEILEYLKQCTIPYDLYVTIPENLAEKDILKLFEQVPDINLYMVENRGRDVLPFLQILNLIRIENYQYLCKLHTKKSIIKDSGNTWRKLLYYDLIGSPQIVKNILDTFEKGPDIGIITGKNLILNTVKFDSGNSNNVKKIAEQSHIPYITNHHFAKGTMFWIRTSLLNPLLSLIESDQLVFEDENEQAEHALPHALERFFGLLCEHAQLSLVQSNAEYRDLDKNTLEELAVLAFTQHHHFQSEIEYKNEIIRRTTQEISIILNSKSYKFTLPFRKIPFIAHTLIHFNFKKIHMPDSNEFRFAEAIKRRVPKKIISILKRIRKKVKKRTKKNQLWHQPLTKISQYKGNVVLIIAELAIPQCTKYRVEQKVEMLENLGYTTWIVSWTDFHEARNLLQLSALVFFYRVPAYPLVIALMNETNRLGITSFFDVDDLIFDKELLAQNINLQQLSKKSQKELLNGATLYQEALSLTTHSTASTQVLGHEMQKYNSGISYLIPNCLDKELLSYVNQNNTPITGDKDTIKIVYGSGTSTHDIDFMEVADALVHILNTYPHVRFIIHGSLTLPKTFDTLSSQITHIPFMPTEAYYAHLQSYDINLAPLEPSIFNDAKSNIKYLEASILRLPTIASNVVEYRAVIQEGENGFIAKDTQAWIAALDTLIHSKELRKTIGQNAHNTVLEHYQIKSIAKKYMLPIVKSHLFHKTTDTKHILMANVLYNPISFGGATIVIEELSKRINQKEGYNTTIFTGFFDDYYDLPRPYDLVRYEVNNVSVILVRFPFPMSKEVEYKNEEMGNVFDKILTSIKPDLVHFHSIQQLSASIAKPCIDHHIPYIITLHDMWWLCEKQFMIKDDNTYCYQTHIDTDYCITQCTHNLLKTKKRTTYLKPFLNSAALLLAPSSFQAQMYRYNNLDPKKIKVNKNAVIFPSSSYKKIPSKTIRFAYLGGNAVHKGYYFLKEIFESITFNNYELVIIDLNKKLGYNSIIASDWDISGTLTLTDGYEYSQKGLDNFFSNIDVLLFPSQWKESFGLTVREALVRDVWVISTDAGGVTEDISENENGNIVPIGDSHGFKRQIEHALENTSTLQNFKNPHKSIIRAYEAQVDELLNYYTDVWDTL